MLVFAAVIFVVFCVTALQLPVSTATSPTATTDALSAPSFPTGAVNVTVFAQPNYVPFDTNVPEQVIVTISLRSLNLSAPVQLELLSSFNPSEIAGSANLANGTSAALLVTIIKGSFGTHVAYYISLPTHALNVSIRLAGAQSAEGFLWRLVTNIPTIQVSGLGVPMAYNTELVIPSSSEIWQAYGFSTASQAGSQIANPDFIAVDAPAGNVAYLVPANVGTLVIRSKLFLPASLALVSVAIVAIAAVGLGTLPMTRKGILTIIGRVVGPLRKFSTGVLGPFHTLVAPLSSRSSAPLRRRLISRSEVKSTELLVFFIICAIVMVSLATMTGPDPNLQAYVIASPTQTHQIHQQLIQAFQNVQVTTPSQDYTDFGVMSSVGMFKVVVISDYPSTALPTVENFVLGSLGNVPIIVLDKGADPSFASAVKALYPNSVLEVNNAGSMSPNESQALVSLVSQASAHNTLGLSISGSHFEYVLVIEGALSFLLIFLGWSFLGARVVENRAELTLSRIGFLIMAGVFVFYFSEVVYVVTSSLLALPLSLHAVISGADTITAVGVLGHALHLPFGGGSTPRLLSGVVGVLFGSLIVPKDHVLFSRKGMVIIGAVVVLLLANPFALGSFAFQGLLLFVGNIPLGMGYASALTFKGFLYGIGAGLGGDASPVYLMSAGKIAYFAGLAPLAFIKKMGKTTASLTLLVSAVLLGDGGVRVGEMTPDKTVIGVLPGIIAGFVIAFVLLLIGALEKYIASNYSRLRP